MESGNTMAAQLQRLLTERSYLSPSKYGKKYWIQARLSQEDQCEIYSVRDTTMNRLCRLKVARFGRVGGVKLQCEYGFWIQTQFASLRREFYGEHFVSNIEAKDTNTNNDEIIWIMTLSDSYNVANILKDNIQAKICLIFQSFDCIDALFDHGVVILDLQMHHFGITCTNRVRMANVASVLLLTKAEIQNPYQTKVTKTDILLAWCYMCATVWKNNTDNKPEIPWNKLSEVQKQTWATSSACPYFLRPILTFIMETIQKNTPNGLNSISFAQVRLLLWRTIKIPANVQKKSLEISPQIKLYFLFC